ncbi:MAG: hypothetical protein JW791_04390 [Nanoarchaeota archaeon]|nr:hypothetical protein [Nanoarchaeota archaeon]
MMSRNQGKSQSMQIPPLDNAGPCYFEQKNPTMRIEIDNIDKFNYPLRVSEYKILLNILYYNGFSLKDIGRYDPTTGGWFKKPVGISVENGFITKLEVKKDCLQLEDKLEYIPKLTHLKIIFLHNPYYLPKSLFKSESLEDLELIEMGNIKELPEEIGQLTQLKVLGVTCGNGRGTMKSYYNLEKIPDSIGNLINLQELDIRCTSLKTIPETIGNLVNLKIFQLKNNNYLTTLPEGLAKLKNLEHLSVPKRFKEDKKASEILSNLNPNCNVLFY